MHHVQLVLVHHQNGPGMRRKIQNQSLGTDISRTIITKNIVKVKKNCYYTKCSHARASAWYEEKADVVRTRLPSLCEWGNVPARCHAAESRRAGITYRQVEYLDCMKGERDRADRHGTGQSSPYGISRLSYYLYLIILPFFFTHFLNDRFCPIANSA